MSRVRRRRVLLAGAGAAGALLAGCSGNGGDDPADRGPIEIRQLAFAADRPSGYDEYEPQPESTYGRGDVVWLYADYEGLSGEPIEAEPGDESDARDGGTDDAEDDQQEDESTRVEIELHQSLTVADPDGAPIVEHEATFRKRLAVPQLERYFTGTEILLPGDVVEGEYEVTVTVTDRVSETEDSGTATFRIGN